MPNLESIAKKIRNIMPINTHGGIKMSEDIARWHAKEVLKARIEEANEHLYQPNSMADNRIKKLTEQLKSLEVEK